MINARVRNILPNIENFLDHCQRRNYKSRSILVSAGDPSESFFFVLDGSLSVVLKSDEGQDMVVNYVNPGDFFGEIGLYKRVDKIREASIQALVKESRAWFILCPTAFRLSANPLNLSYNLPPRSAICCALVF